jgi:phosphonate transport system ATP-binding protein
LKLALEALSARHPAAKAEARAALVSVSLSIGSGEQVAVIGPSGSGKTTLLQVLACALKPESGIFKIDDVDPWLISRSALQRLRGQLFLAPQTPPLPPRQRVVTAVLAGLLPQRGLWQSLYSLVRPQGSDLAHAALARFDLSEKLFDRVDRLSGGERQRVGLARAVLAAPSLLLVDEPLSALDPTRSTQAVRALVDGATEHRSTLVCTLHQVPMALGHFPRIIGMREGRIAFDLPSGQVTQAMLEALYANQLEELSGAAPVIAEPQAGPQPVVMHCR